MKKLFLVLALAVLGCFMLACAVSAKDVYLEPIPEELKVPNDTVTHFVVFEEEKYFTGDGDTISGLNNDQMNADMASAGIDSSKIGTEYLTRFNIPAYLNGTLVTYVNLNSMKGNFSGKCGYIQLAGTVTKIHDMNNCTNQLRCFDFGENSQITSIPYCFAPSSAKLSAVKNFPRNLETIEGDAFNRCYRAFKGELYLNAKTIKSGAFNNSLSHLTGLVFGPNTQKIENQSLCIRLSEFNDKPADGLVQIEYIEFQCDVSQVNFAVQGYDIGAFYFIGGNTRSPYSKLKAIILSHPNNASQIKEGSTFNDFTPDGVTILFNDPDGLDDYVTASHSFVDGDISYTSFLENGVKNIVCSNCGLAKTEVAPAIFVCLGYSVPTYGAPSFSIGYQTNFEALDAYENASNVTVSYGIVAAVKSNLGNSTPLDENGNKATLENGSVIVAELNRATAYFDGIVTGFKNDTQKSSEIVLCAYTIVKDAEENIIEISYLIEKNADGSLVGKSYNSLTAE